MRRAILPFLTGTRAVAALVLGLALAACSEEDRRAWVSILPSSDEEGSETGQSGPFEVTPDSTAMLLGSDTLFTVARIPREAEGNVLQPARIGTAVVAPDSMAVAVELVGPTPAVAVWSRSRQTAAVARTFSGGDVTALAWSPGGRLLAFEGHDATGTPRSGVFDVETGVTGRHAVQRWLERRGMSIRFQAWVTRGRARFLAGTDPAGGLAYLWDIESGTFLLESHAPALAANAPEGVPQRSGIFSVDLIGDPLPESVALYRASDGTPGALVLVDAGPGGVRASLTRPLLPPSAVGLEEWKATTAGPELYQIAEVGGRTTVLLAVPTQSPFVGIALFQLDGGGQLAPVPMVTESGMAPAILPEGTVGNETRQLGITDLDGDGVSEVVTASGQREAGGAARWSADVFRWESGRLVPAPDLASAALARIQSLIGGG